MSTSTPVSVLEYFDLIRAEGGIVARETPKLDLDLYIGNYRGRTRFDRLLHIGRTSVVLCVDALKAAVAEAKRGRDVGNFTAAWDALRDASPGEPELQLADQWRARIKESNKTTARQLDHQMQAYKANLIKETIKLGHEEHGQFLESTGDLTGAQDAYARMRPDVSTVQNIIDVGKHLVRVAILRKDWNAALNSLSKTTISVSSGTGTIEEDERLPQRAYADVVKGICHLGLANFDEAAKSFLQAEQPRSRAEYDEITSLNDVAVYGGLLALATMDRQALRSKVLANSTFKAYLEHEPHIRKAISLFVGGRYSACLGILDAYRADYLLDIYLSRHLAGLYSRIREKCMVQFFVPFTCVSFEEMQREFGLVRDEAGRELPMEEELLRMIRTKVLPNGRLDLERGYLVDMTPSPRQVIELRTQRLTERLRQTLEPRLFNMQVCLHGLEVRHGIQASGVATKPAETEQHEPAVAGTAGSSGVAMPKWIGEWEPEEMGESEGEGGREGSGEGEGSGGGGGEKGTKGEEREEGAMVVVDKEGPRADAVEEGAGMMEDAAGPS